MNSDADSAGPKSRFESTAVAIVATLVLLAANVFIGREHSSLAQRRDELRALKLTRAEKIVRLGKLKKRIAKIQFQVHALREYLISKLTECTSRDDFLIREGEHIGWCHLKRDDFADGPRVAVYLPPGRHRLKMAIQRFTGPDSKKAMILSTLNVDLTSIPGTQSMELRGGEVYEIRVISLDSATASSGVDVIGRSNDRVGQIRTPVPSGAIRWMLVNGSREKRGLAYPNSLQSSQVTPRQLSRRGGPPVTELLHAITMTNASRAEHRLGLRCWIESDTPPCIPIVSAVTVFQKLARIRSVDPDAEFGRLFQPYDGSGRLYFRDHAFGLASQ